MIFFNRNFYLKYFFHFFLENKNFYFLTQKFLFKKVKKKKNEIFSFFSSTKDLF